MEARFLLLFTLAALLSGCALKNGASQQVVEAKGDGDAEAIHGGDPLDLKLLSIRGTMQQTLTQINRSQKLESLGRPLFTCNDFPARALCEAVNAPEIQREKARLFILRNAAALKDLSFDGRLKLSASTFNQTQLNPDGTLRSVTAWTRIDAGGAAEIFFNKDALQLKDIELFALLAHELGHVLIDSELGRITDNMTVADFTSPSGDGRYFLDLVAVELAVYAHETLLKIDDAGLGGTGKGFSAGVLAMTHGGSFDNQSALKDFDGDGKKDLIFIGTDNSIGLSRFDRTAWSPPVKIGKMPGTFEQKRFMFPDLNGDGKADVVYRDGNTVTGCLSDGVDYFDTCATIIQIPSEITVGEWMNGDYNGDRKADFIARDVTSGATKLYSCNGLSCSLTATMNIPGIQYLRWGNVLSDSDKLVRDDLIYRDSANRFWIRKAANTGFLPPVASVAYEGTPIAGQDMLVDFDGDGLKDLIYRKADNSFWVNHSLGQSLGEATNVANQGGNSYEQNSVYFEDFNGDGKMDLLFQRQEGGHNKLEVRYSNGTNFGPVIRAFDLSYATVGGQVKVADVDGDGRADITVQTGSNSFWLWISQEGR